MHVVATAGHVDHGKSSLVTALTGTDPDRHPEEKRRGLTLDLGFAWTAVDGEDIAFVDVPGHERFVPTMLAGVGPVPAALFVVAADSGWMPQSQEHLDALDAFGVRHGLLVVTRSDLADPGPALRQASGHLADSTLRGIGAVAVSTLTGAGLDALRSRLVGLVRALPAPDAEAPVRLWVDRVFTIRGAGTVVTGTLGRGTVRTGDTLQLPGGRQVTVRAVQCLGRQVHQARAVARVALNLRGVATDDVRRGDALTTPGSHVETSLLDVRLGRPVDLPSQCLVHVGSAGVTARIRPFGTDTARLSLSSPLPLHVGDAGLLRDPGRRRVLTGFTALDVDPPALRARGAGRRRAGVLSRLTGIPDTASELSRRRVVRRETLLAMGVPAPGSDPWLVDPGHAEQLRQSLRQAVDAHARRRPLEVGLPVEAARQHLGLPDAALVATLLTGPLAIQGGRVVDTRRLRETPLPPRVADAVVRVRAELRRTPYAAPDAQRLRDLELGPRELAAAARAGSLVKLADGVYLTPEAVTEAHLPLRPLAQPFTLSAARQAWATSRRVAVPLLELLDRDGRTRRLPDDRRVLTDTSSAVRAGASAQPSRLQPENDLSGGPHP